MGPIADSGMGKAVPYSFGHSWPSHSSRMIKETIKEKYRLLYSLSYLKLAD